MNIDLSSTSRAHVQRCLRGRMIYYVCMRIHADKRKYTHEHKPSLHNTYETCRWKPAKWNTHGTHTRTNTNTYLATLALLRSSTCSAVQIHGQHRCNLSVQPPVVYHDQIATQNTHLNRHTAHTKALSVSKAFTHPWRGQCKNCKSRGNLGISTVSWRH